LEVINRLGLKEQFDTIATELTEIRAMKTSVEISKRPYINYSPPQWPKLRGRERCELKLIWEYPGSVNYPYYIAVEVEKGKLFVISDYPGDRSREEFEVDQIDIDKLNKTLMNAYEHPVGTAPRYD
jgi:hypothetical protein